MNALVSYAYLEPRTVEFIEQSSEHGVAKIMLDSGAFSAFTQGKVIRLGEYMAMCRRLQPHLFSYIMLDVLEDKEATKKNLDVFLKKGLTPMPVWTMDGNLRDLEWMKPRCNGQMCIAGGALSPITWTGPRLKIGREMLGEETFIHALGFTSIHASSCPIDSVDSSSYKGAGRFGQVSTYSPERGIRNASVGDLRKKSFSELKPWVRTLLAESELPEAFLGRQHKGLYSPLYLIGVWAWMRYALDMKRHGIRLFFAFASFQELGPLALCAHYLNRPKDWEAIERDIELMKELMRHDIPTFSKFFAHASREAGLAW